MIARFRFIGNKKSSLRLKLSRGNLNTQSSVREEEREYVTVDEKFSIFVFRLL